MRLVDLEEFEKEFKKTIEENREEIEACEGFVAGMTAALLIAEGLPEIKQIIQCPYKNEEE